MSLQAHESLTAPLERMVAVVSAADCVEVVVSEALALSVLALAWVVLSEVELEHATTRVGDRIVGR